MVEVGGAHGLGSGLVVSLPTPVLTGLVWAGWDCVVEGNSPANGLAASWPAGWNVS